jgi:hypothetical protein
MSYYRVSKLAVILLLQRIQLVMRSMLAAEAAIGKHRVSTSAVNRRAGAGVEKQSVAQKRARSYTLATCAGRISCELTNCANATEPCEG